MVRVSIAMATYNGGQFLQEQLGSILLQSRMPDEVVISDDGSDDDTLEIADFRVVVLRGQGRLGFSRNFERAISQCSGDVVFFCDQDDRWFPDKIAAVLGAFDLAPMCQLVIHDREVADSGMVPSGKTSIGENMRVRGDLSRYVAGCATAVRRLSGDAVGWL